MILVDTPKGSKASQAYRNQLELKTLIRAMGQVCEITPLSWGDAALDGNGPKGPICVGIEIKRLHDLLNCIDDGHLNKQRVGMKGLYDKRYLLVEGFWRPREDGLMMESRNGREWWICRPHGRPVMYSKVYRYLLSVELGGMSILYSQNLWHTAFNICEVFHYFQKRWSDHTSLLEIHHLAIPQLNFKPSLVHRWAHDLDGVGVKYSVEAARLFKKGRIMANASEEDWMKIPGIGVKTARDIVRQINGGK